MTALPFSFAWPWALLLLLLLPAWWLWRRRRRPPAIVFSRVGTLALGPRTGKGVARALFILRNLLLAGMIVALARPEKKPLGIAIGLLMVSSAVSMSVPFTIGKLIDYFSSTNPVSPPYI